MQVTKALELVLDLTNRFAGCELTPDQRHALLTLRELHLQQKRLGETGSIGVTCCVHTQLEILDSGNMAIRNRMLGLSIDLGPAQKAGPALADALGTFKPRYWE